MLRSFVFIFLFSVFSHASENEVRATIQFQIWQPKLDLGILIEHSGEREKEACADFLLEQESGNQHISCRELRPTRRIKYRGNGHCVLSRKVDGELQPILNFYLPHSGDYRVLLTKASTAYSALVIPLNEQQRPLGSLWMVNTTRDAISVQQAGSRAVHLRRGETKLLQLRDTDHTAVHLTIRVRKDGKWHTEYQRPYVLGNATRSVCLFYQPPKQQRLCLKLFSGL